MNLIDHLPRNSAYVEAKLGDRDLAQEIAKLPEPDDLPGRRISEWSTEAELLTSLLDAVRENTRVLLSVNRNRPPQFRPAPRPVTALEQVKREARIAGHRALVARIVPHPA